MWMTVTGFGILFAAVGWLFVKIAQPLIDRKIKPNPWYGFRTAKTLSNEDIWFAANEYSGRTLRVVGILTAIAALLLLPLALLGLVWYLWSVLGVMLGSLGWSVVKSFQYLRKLESKNDAWPQ